MADVMDVAKYILSVQGPMTTWKLQKLVYYSQAWSLVWDGVPLFGKSIKAWANGPVVPWLYRHHKGLYRITPEDIEGDERNLSVVEKETILAVLQTYGDKSPQWLSDLTHMEPPWNKARKGLAPGERGNRTISLADMAEYYESIN
jgi:uncharacterized phage-associated protein